VPAADAASVRRPMSREECSALLRDIGWGVLAVAEPHATSAIPVAVPTAYAYDGECIYVAMSSGRKRDALRRNPHLCLTITDVGSLDCWRSVVVIGAPRWIVDDAARARAIAAFAAQRRPSNAKLSSRSGTRLARASVLAVEVQEMHGFACGDGNVDSESRSDAEMASAEGDALCSAARSDLSFAADCSDPATQAMNAVRRIVRALRSAQDSSEAVLGLTGAQLFVLREIEKSGTPSISELAHRTATVQSSVSEVVARLAARGLVSRGRAAGDRRRASIALTASGHRTLASAPETVQERMLAAFDRLDDDVQQALSRSLAAWIAESGLGDVAATMLLEPLLEQDATLGKAVSSLANTTNT